MTNEANNTEMDEEQFEELRSTGQELNRLTDIHLEDVREWNENRKEQYIKSLDSISEELERHAKALKKMK